MGLFLMLIGLLILATTTGAADLNTTISLTEITVLGLLGLVFVFVGVAKAILED